MAARPAPRRAIGIDIGSNTFSICILEGGDGRFTVTDDVSTAVRLSEGLVPGGRLSPVAVERCLKNLEEMAPRFGVARTPTRAVGTQVLRMTSAPEEFTDRAREILGVEVEIIDGREEALLVFRGAMLGLDAEGPWIVFDIGGQSTELCFRGDGGALVPLSIPLGVVGLSERFLADDPPTPEQVAALEVHIRAAIADAIPTGMVGELLGVAGTSTSLGALEVSCGGFDREKIHGAIVSRERLRHWLSTLLAITAAKRTALYGIGHARADVFPTGLMLLDAVLAHLGRDRVRVSVNGLRVGAALSILER